VFHTSEECYMSAMKRFLRDESGATAIEYGLIAAGISVVIITVVVNIGTALLDRFEFIQTKLNETPKS
jgi:pilus assembly protein Flp/PilA